MPVERVFIGAGAVSGFLAVAAGAFGAHALRTRLSPELLAVFETAVRYQIYHALALIGTAWVYSRWTVPPAAWAGWLFLAGTVVFSGSLYVLSLSGVRAWGAVTPLGGLAFLLGWASLTWAAAVAR